MALVVCPDCQTQVSDAAVACVKCGRPVFAAPSVFPASSEQPTRGGEVGGRASSVLSSILQFLGYGWAVLGGWLLGSTFLDTVRKVHESGGEATNAEGVGILIAVVFYGLVFIFPGLVVGALGTIVSRRRRT